MLRSSMRHEKSMAQIQRLEVGSDIKQCLWSSYFDAHITVLPDVIVGIARPFFVQAMKTNKLRKTISFVGSGDDVVERLNVLSCSLKSIVLSRKFISKITPVWVNLRAVARATTFSRVLGVLQMCYKGIRC